MPVGLSHRGITNSLQIRVVGAQPAIRTRKQVVLSYPGMPFPSPARGADPRNRTGMPMVLSHRGMPVPFRSAMLVAALGVEPRNTCF